MYDKASELYNDLLEIYFDEYNDLSVAKKKINPKYNPDNLMFNTYEYQDWYEEEESDDSTLKNKEDEFIRIYR